MKMKVTIKYSVRAGEFPCLAEVDDGIKTVVAVGRDWAQAKENAIQRYRNLKGIGEPPPAEEVEVAP